MIERVRIDDEDGGLLTLTAVGVDGVTPYLLLQVDDGDRAGVRLGRDKAARLHAELGRLLEALP